MIEIVNVILFLLLQEQHQNFMSQKVALEALRSKLILCFPLR